MVAEGLAGVHVGQVDFDHRQFAGDQGVADGDRGVGPRGRIDDDPGAATAGGVNPVEQFAFMVGLAKLNCQAELFGGTCAQGRDVCQGFVTVSRRFTGTEQVQVRAVEHQNDRGHQNLSTFYCWNRPRIPACGDKLY
ncbi:hypothetical protein D9M73_224720 [compost metagenome]